MRDKNIAIQLLTVCSSFLCQGEKPEQGTVAPAANFNSDKDAESLKDAMKGFGKYFSMKQFLS